MNPLVAKIIGDLPISPVDSVWFDVTDESIGKVYSNWMLLLCPSKGIA